MRPVILSLVASTMLVGGLLAGPHALPSTHAGTQPPLLGIIWGDAK